MLDDEKLLELSEAYLATTGVCLKHGFSRLECGTTMLALALKIMQECLSPEDFKLFVKEIPLSAELIMPHNIEPSGSIH